ncbi:MAG: hypothetical protein J6X86_00670 [Bacteroidales bacterium]|nr:hypothetical protein [Bacteroidales bacterium]
MKTKTDIKKATSKQPQNVAGNSVFCHSDFTGKELDSETDFYYFGARYLDHTLLTSWFTVDPMSDKYPSLSPYNYCAWNPVKLVDPEGMDIDVSALSEELQKRLVDCIGYITGLNLAVENGLLVSKGVRNGKYRFSKSAREDLQKVMDNHEKVIFVGENSNVNQDEYAVDKQGNDWILLGSFHQKECDNKTNGLGMLFFHELGHAYFGDDDPPNNEATFFWNDPDKEYPAYKTGPHGVGEAVARVNKYRKEMGMPLRKTYEACYHLEGTYSSEEGKIPFEGTHRWTDEKGKTHKYKGTVYLPLK